MRIREGARPGHGDDAPGGRPGEASDLELVRTFQSRPHGDPEAAKACEILIRRHEALVWSCVRRYLNGPESAEDLMQVGYMGLMKAINNFDPDVGDNLAAYAKPCVAGEIKRHFRDKRWQIKVHRSAQELRLRIRHAAGELAQHLGRTPRDADMAAYLGVSEAEVAEAHLASQAFQVAYLDAPLNQDDEAGASTSDMIGADDGQLEHFLHMDSVWTHLSEMPDREQKLLMMRFYGNMTQQQIGSELGISQMHVSRLLGHALGYLRERITGIPESGTASGAERV